MTRLIPTTETERTLARHILRTALDVTNAEMEASSNPHRREWHWKQHGEMDEDGRLVNPIAADGSIGVALRHDRPSGDAFDFARMLDLTDYLGTGRAWIEIDGDDRVTVCYQIDRDSIGAIREGMTRDGVLGELPAVLSTDDSPRTTAEAALELGISEGRVRQLADSRNVGRKVGDRRYFTPADVDAMRERAPGRPRKVQ